MSATRANRRRVGRMWWPLLPRRTGLAWLAGSGLEGRARVVGSVALVGLAILSGSAAVVGPPALEAQEATEGEVRQLVTFRFLPGKAAEARAIFRDRALPLYRENPAMTSFRAFREVESPVPLDLIVVSGFQGMAGMDESNEALRDLAAGAGTTMGAVYGEIASLSATHDDQLVAMLPELAVGDPADGELVAMISYRLLPGERERFLRTLREETVPWERERGIPSSTGRFLVSDGWHYLRVVGFDSLGDYQAYWLAAEGAGHGYIDGITTRRREILAAPVSELAVR